MTMEELMLSSWRFGDMRYLSKNEIRNALLVAALTTVVIAVVAQLHKLLWRPLRMRRIMAKQGIGAAPFRIVFGNLTECAKYAAKFPEDLHVDNHYDSLSTVSPQFALFFPNNGNFFLYEWGSETRLAVRDPEFAKEVLTVKQAYFTKPQMNKFIVGDIVGHESLAIVDDPQHATQRRILNSFFYAEALKAMVDAMVEGAMPGIQKWEEKVTQGGGVADFDVLPDIHMISGKVISHTAFGGDNEKGRRIYECQSKLVEILFASLMKPTFWIPGFRLLPTKTNREVARLKREMHTILNDIVGARKKAFDSGTAGSYGDDLLGQMLLAAASPTEKANGFNLKAVLDNAQLFFFAGQDTVANAIAYALLMLARHPDWQARARKEVNDVCGSRGTFHAGKLNNLKTLGMIINETQRLFIVLPKLPRVATKDVQIGDLHIPKGLAIEIASQAMHYDATLWGEDAYQFNPERFANGSSNACAHPQAFLPFSVGPKFCIGNNFAVMELKLVIAMVLQRFQINVSPNYKHHPHFALVQRPKYGMQLVLKAL